MDYLMKDLKICVINDAVFFSNDGETSILDEGKKLPIQGKEQAGIVDYVRDGGENSYYSVNFTIGCIDFLKKRYAKSKTAKQFLSMYSLYRIDSMFPAVIRKGGIADFLEHTRHSTISYDRLLDLYCDIANGFDRKMATIRVADKMGTDALDEISTEDVNREIAIINKDRAIKLTQAYSKFNDNLDIELNK